ncbi:AraC family transcriptional regulator [Vibrio mangrovi]|uniref:AraC family transcriptional regulator n=1 Tax=Vibrio mangrovi TaxID=474394 RepID=A0A1Y6IWP6_9VIBR|nr:AraC family transcriptional regulator [Vibrio mangrovi]MDW6005481.1 AraC family transcriptional regulator [Vibrio mangrovi]SMS02077.1 Right origin-binding protein [Vibrio mangrovi]
MRDNLYKTVDERIHQVCHYIENHLCDDLTLDHLSQIAALSRYHFHRVFSAYIGMSVARYIQLMRLKRASMQLAFETDLRVIDIALDAGYDSPESFARAFKKTFGQSPSGFRTAPEWLNWHAQFQSHKQPWGEQHMHVEIKNFSEAKIAFITHQGPIELVYETATQFIAWRKESGLSPVSTSKTYGIPYGNPDVVAPEAFRFDIGGSVEQDVPENTYGVQTGTIPGGRCAVIRHKGSHDRLGESIYYLYRDWLPQSGETLRDYPCFFHYLNLINEVPESDLITDVYLPIQ